MQNNLRKLASFLIALLCAGAVRAVDQNIEIPLLGNDDELRLVAARSELNEVKKRAERVATNRKKFSQSATYGLH